MSDNLFKKVCDEVNVHDVVRWLGIKEHNGFIKCPFHSDRHPSMKVYRDGAYCFACGTHADAVSLAAQVLNLSQYDALLMIVSAFSLSMDIPKGKPKEKPTAEDLTPRMIALWCSSLKRLLQLYSRQTWKQGRSCDWVEKILDDGFTLSDEEFFERYNNDCEVILWLNHGDR